MSVAISINLARLYDIPSFFYATTYCCHGWFCCTRYQYDGEGSDGESCKITTYKEDLSCTISFDVEKDIPGPAYVYYELTNFYQNHAT